MPQRTYNCEPTLTDTQVLEFCANGFLTLEAVVPEEINRRTLEFLPARGPSRQSNEPVEILEEDWFVENVILNPRTAGAVRSLLGKDFGLPTLISSHRLHCPEPGNPWHRDAGSMYGPALNYLQVFYYPQDTPLELGPTLVLPGSHFLFSTTGHMGHYGNIRGEFTTASPAGTIFITVYSIWHRRPPSRGTGIRENLKYNYWRTSPPNRDWIKEADFDFAKARYGSGGGAAVRSGFRSSYDNAEMFFWLSDMSEKFRYIGGQAWPTYHDYGIPPDLTND